MCYNGGAVEKRALKILWRGMMALSICLSIILVLVTLDQVTKLFFMETEFSIIKGIIEFEPRLNDGAAFSSLRGERVFFIVFTVIALFVMFYILLTGWWSKHKFFKITLAVMIGGVIGNFIDRMMIGAVRDFIYLPPFNFVCNIADIAITAACVMFIIYLFFIRDKEELEKKTKVSKQPQTDTTKNE